MYEPVHYQTKTETDTVIADAIFVKQYTIIIHTPLP